MTKILRMLAVILVLLIAAAGLASAEIQGVQADKKGDGEAYCDGPGGTCVIADFIGSPTDGTAPLKVQFLDSSTGYPEMWVWDFGDGNSAKGPSNPVHIYSEPGIYTVTLTVTSATGGSSTKVRQKYITVRDKNSLQADFLADPTYGNAPLKVQFADCSKGTVKEWKWDFGDGGTSTEQSPSHIYQKGGKYTVSLTVSSPTAGTDTKVREKYVIVEGGCIIESKFKVDPPGGPAPLTVQFTDQSKGGPTMWAWDFGDGTTDMVANPIHTYEKPGLYQVRLTASSQDCEAGTSETTVKVDQRPVKADFSADPRTGDAPLSVRFKDLSSGKPTMWAWDFGDGTTDMVANPVHVYQLPGTYSVTLTASNQFSSDKVTKSQFVTVKEVAINADFVGAPTSGYAPLKVTFSDLSTGKPTMWAWDFGDGTTEMVGSPTHVYSKPGIYTVTLTASSQYGSSDTETKKGYINVMGPPIKADFDANPQSGYVPLTVQFTDKSSGKPTMWAWNFGDGSSDVVANPVHTYSKAGYYNVTLTASNQYGSDTVTKSQWIKVMNIPVKADFVANPQTGNAPLTVTFTDRSTGGPTMWAWNFGDGSSDVVANPVHTYSKPGVYSVTLTASNQYGSDTVTKNQLIKVTNIPIKADFVANPQSGNAPLTVTFTDRSTGGPTMWAWDFGDGGTDMVANPVHTYSKPGIYSVTLTASNQYGSDKVTKNQFINASDVSINTDFVGTPTSGIVPLTVTFTDKSSGKPTMWAWDFGDGTTDMVANPVHTYSKPGSYTVILTASSQYGSSDTEIKPGYINVMSTPIKAEFDGNPKSGCTPLTVTFTDKSSGKPTMWAWDFGDGTTDMVANPVHTYSKPGSYTVTLTASDQYGGRSVATKPGFIVAESCPPLKADFDGNPKTGNVPLSVAFTDRSTGNPMTWAWDFGDGGSDVVANPVHVYKKEGKYSVRLTVTNKRGSDTVIKSEYITANVPYDDKIPVYAGWNFISVPKKLATGSDTASIFKCINTGGHSMFMYDTGKRLWNVIDPDTPIKPLEGYWVYSVGPAYIPLMYDHNPVQTPPVANLKKGWNAIGFSGTKPIEAKFTLLSVQDKWVNCVSYNAAIQQYDPMIIKGSNDSTMMNPYLGYWLYMTADGVLAANAA